MRLSFICLRLAGALLAAGAALTSPAAAQSLAYGEAPPFPVALFPPMMPQQDTLQQQLQAPDHQFDRSAIPETDKSAEVPERLRRRVVDYPTHEPAGTIIVDTPNTYLYYVLGGGKAMRYGIGVGREGFTWSGVKSVERKTEWPDWVPPPEMIARQPYLPRWMAGGPGNPLGARALYVAGTQYRIHGTNDPSSIGKHVSSGCIRMLNEDVEDLYRRAAVGAKVVVLPANARSTPAVAKQRTAPVAAVRVGRAPSAAPTTSGFGGIY
ncbi:MAG TPA: L,D-transpeptidase [Xanthobacteraceae bacterium]|nr:L,D-transpeptidase [Xanthobacteraceae bacterium]